MSDLTSRLAGLLEQLTLEDKVTLLTGRDFWTTWPLPVIGLRSMLLSDGPSGVRGEVWDERDPSLSLPSATALSSSWDTAMAWRYGAAAAVEARRKGVDVVLGPTINLHRSPLGGRHFEAFSEDPVLTADLAASYVSGVQAGGVAATPKHYVANDSETDRFTVDARIDERTLREVYLLAFEKAITGAHAWAVMSAYNSVNGVTATENDLLETPLNSEWGFDGVVISDWTAVRSLAAASASQDLVMPGPQGAWGPALVAAVRGGEIEESLIDRKVLRLLHLAVRVGALEGFEPVGSVAVPPAEDGVAFVREACAAGTVLLRNAGELPWDACTLTSVAVIGHNASAARFQGGGSATVLPERVTSPLEGLREALPGLDVTYSLGAVVAEGVAAIPLEQLRDPVTGDPGVRVAFLDAAGTELQSEHRLSTELVWFGGSAPIAASATLELATRWTPQVSGTVLLGFASVGRARIWCDASLLLDRTVAAAGTDLGAALLAPPSVSGALTVVAGQGVDLRIEYELGERVGPLAHSLSFTFGTEPDRSDPDGLIAEAVAAAAAAQVALVVVGTNSAVESEGYDRTSLALPGRQDDLVRAVAAANPRTVVVVNAGSPVLLPWRDDVAALAVTYFGGQEIGHALADVLLGAVEPGGRLPTTWPAAQEDVPVLDTTPVDGALVYSEGLHIGYRAWLNAAPGEPRVEPAFWFGHGSGYTQWSLGEVSAPARVSAGEAVEVEVALTNTGARPGKEVVQVYAERPGSSIERPVRWLVGFATVTADPGQTLTARISVPTRLLAHWVPGSGWAYEPGEFTLRIGTSVVELPRSTTLVLVVT